MTTKAKVIAICNQKGGVGKTTTAVNLGIGLSMQGKRILLIDADPQGDLTTCLGITDADSLDVSTASIMRKIVENKPLTEKEGILHHKEGVDFLPANLELSAMDMVLVNAMNREKTLKQYVAAVRKNYDYILIDCMPSLGMITVNALSAADRVIIPVQAQFLPAKGMTQLLQIVSKVKRHINPKLKIDGILVTLVDNRTNLAASIRKTLRENYGPKIRIYQSEIPVAAKAAESSGRGESIYSHDKNNAAAKAYMDFTKEVLADGEKEGTNVQPSHGR